MLVVGNRSSAADAAQIITRVWNQVLERDNLRSWQRDIEVHFGERSKSSDHSEFKLWLQGQNLVGIWLLTLSNKKQNQTKREFGSRQTDPCSIIQLQLQTLL